MIIETRKTAQGTEYWDNVAKKTLFVPAGEESLFEVTENPVSMLIAVDLAKGNDKTVVEGEVIDSSVSLNEMNTDQLLTYAKENEIDVPGNIKKEETIRKYIEEALAANDGE